MDRTFLHASGFDEFARKRREFSRVKFLRFVMKLLGFLFRHRIFAGERRKFFNLRPHFRRGQVDDAFGMAAEVVGGLGFLNEAQKEGPAESPEGRDRGEIGFAVFVEGTDESDWRAKVKNFRLDGSEFGFGDRHSEFRLAR